MNFEVAAELAHSEGLQVLAIALSLQTVAQEQNRQEILDAGILVCRASRKLYTTLTHPFSWDNNYLVGYGCT